MRQQHRLDRAGLLKQISPALLRPRSASDRIAQEVVRRRLEPVLEPLFHADSYGYRPRSAIDAVRTARRRCWRYHWVLDIDIKGSNPLGLLLE